MIVQIQYQSFGFWIDSTTINQPNPSIIQSEMREVQKTHPNSRVRAVDSATGSLVDIL